MESCSPFISSGMGFCLIFHGCGFSSHLCSGHFLGPPVFPRDLTLTSVTPTHALRTPQDAPVSCFKMEHPIASSSPVSPQRSPRALVPCGLYPLECGLLLVTRRKGNGTPPPRQVRETGFLPPAALSHALFRALSFAQLPCYKRLRHVGTSM